MARLRLQRAETRGSPSLCPFLMTDLCSRAGLRSLGSARPRSQQLRKVWNSLRWTYLWAKWASTKSRHWETRCVMCHGLLSLSQSTEGRPESCAHGQFREPSATANTVPLVGLEMTTAQRGPRGQEPGKPEQKPRPPRPPRRAARVGCLAGRPRQQEGERGEDRGLIVVLRDRSLYVVLGST